MPIQQRYIEERRYNEGIEIIEAPPPSPIQLPGTNISGAGGKSGQVTLDAFTADQNDLSLGEGYSFRLGTDGVARTITGFANVFTGRVIYIHNRFGAANISLANDNAGSIAQNRIFTGTGGTVAIQPNRSAILLYDGEDTHWLLIAFT